MLLGYARCSTIDQDPALQLDALTAAGCERIWTETASGAAAERPQLVDLLSHARGGDTLVVWRLDRLGRSLPHLIGLLADLEQREVEFRSLTEALDTSTAGGRLVFNIFASIAAFERQLVQERTQAGLAAARARGRVGGRPTVMTPAKIRTARRMIDDGETLTAVGAAFSGSRTTLYRHLGTTAQTSGRTATGRATSY
ncbi:MAG: recombinase family protein [Candidatus Nanopelagicales bacterium]